MSGLLGKTVSELPEATTANDGDLFAFSQSGASKKLLYSTLRDLIRDGQISLEETYTGLAMFNRIGVIGDSFSSGGMKFSDDDIPKLYENSWIQIIARKLGITGINYSYSGYSTHNFCDSTNASSSTSIYNKFCFGALSNDIADGIPCGLYIFAFGINDATDISLGQYEIGTRADLTNYEDSFYGNTGKIISKILTDAPNSKVIMQTFCRRSSDTSWTEQVNNAIIDIANYYSLPYVDLRTDPFMKSSYYLDNLLNSHPTLDTYVGYANAIMRLYTYCIMDHHSYFYDYRNTGIINSNYYKNGDVLVLGVSNMEFTAVASSSTELRVFIPLSKPVRARSFTASGVFFLRASNDLSIINPTIVASGATDMQCTVGGATICENGISFTLIFATAVLSQRQIYAFQPSNVSGNELRITFGSDWR